MDMSQARQKQRHGLEPTQRRVRHIKCILARNLTFAQNANQRTLTSALLHQPSSQYSQGNTVYYNLAQSSTNSSNSYRPLPHHQHTRSATPSLDLPSSASSPTRGYFRSPWKGYQYGIPKVRGPGSDTGSTSAVSESGRGATSVIREPIARLSAGLKATVFSGGTSAESGYTSESGSTSGKGASSVLGTTPSTSKSRLRNSMEVLSRNSVSDRQKLPQEELSTGRHSLDTSSSVPSTPPPSLPARDKYFSPGEEAVPRFAKGMTEDISDDTPTVGPDSEKDSRMPPFVTKARSQSKPVLLDTYFTFHNPSNDDVIYTSDTVAGSNNPSYSPLEQHRFVDLTARRSNSVIIRIWAGYRGSDHYNLLEWRVDLCCLQYIGKDLRDIPAGLPNNTILFGFESGFYTAPDEDDVLDHPHTTTQEPIASIPGMSLKRSYTYECVMRLNNLHECIADTRESRNEIKRNIEGALVKENAPMILQKRRGECTERLWHLQRQVGHELNVLEQAQHRATTLRQEHAARRKALAESRERGQTQEMYLEENMINLAKNKESLFHVLREFSTKRTELIATLFTIFPITGSDKDSKPLKICNVPLPNSDYTGLDDEVVAVALGFACHLITMLAHYLSVPLRYPLTPMGSRAFVLDPVSLLVGPREFPLYGKGQDRLRFEYGVFLLNKDIEQLMNAYGRQFMDLRRTLPNLRDLMETLITKKQRQERIEPERRNDHFITLREQHEVERGLDASVEGTTDQGLGGSGGAGSGSQPGHERQTSATRFNPGDHSLLVREYDPVDGEYVLILDNTPVRSPRSPRDATGSDVSPVERISPRNIPTSPRGVQLAHERMRSGLHHDYSSSLSLSSTATDDNEDGQCADHPAFRDWASVAPEPVRDPPCETNLETTAPSVATSQVEGDMLKAPSSPFDSKISKHSIDNDLGPNHVSNSDRDNSRANRHRLSEGSSVSERSSPELQGHIGKTSSSTTFSSSLQTLPTHLSKLGLNIESSGLNQQHGIEATTGKDAVEEVPGSTKPTHSSYKSTDRKEHSAAHAEERSRQDPPHTNSFSESRLHLEQPHEQGTLEKRERRVSFEEGRQPIGVSATVSLEGAFSDPNQVQKQRGARLSNRVIMAGSNEAERTKSEEMVYSQMQPSTPTATSSVLEASG
ncbi:hypothetical protein BGZ70_005524 [Mortierella alpina]|uniref:Autophagy-related protein 14 n=1 Tax=Mortierella alpina TaxID=64518 RepID=A0A9P6J948_MORAP|nr:hypothetical protein BGZ70_005524 [Mortierella alpina]